MSRAQRPLAPVRGGRRPPQEALDRPPAPEPEPEPDDNGPMKIAQLRELAEKAGINHEGMKKAELIEALKPKPDPE